MKNVTLPRYTIGPDALNDLNVSFPLTDVR